MSNREYLERVLLLYFEFEEAQMGGFADIHDLLATGRLDDDAAGAPNAAEGDRRLKDLAAMRAPFPLAAAGLVGSDANGDWIIRDCQAAGTTGPGLRNFGPTAQPAAEVATSTTSSIFFMRFSCARARHG